MDRHKQKSQLPVSLNAAYTGYSGLKSQAFPISPRFNQNSYPDITATFHQFKDEIVAEVQAVQQSGFLKGRWRALKLLARRFPTAEAWDTKYHPNFPGRDKNGNLQYAWYKGKIVPATYISNALYSQVLASLGYPLWFIRTAAHMDACGVAQLLFKQSLPSRELRQFRDTPQDQQAIVSGFYDYHAQDPWHAPVMNAYSLVSRRDNLNMA